MGFEAYFPSEPPPTQGPCEAYIRVRVVEAANDNGYVGVYLPRGTRLVVSLAELLRYSSDCD